MKLGPDTYTLQAYNKLLAAIGGEADEIGRHVVTHWPHVGSAYRGLVIVGQALNGWDDHFPASQFRTQQGRADALRTTRARNAGEEPLQWIETVSARTSPFWRTAKMVVEALEPDNRRPWWARFAWVNLYPVAPWRPPGNPSGALRRVQDQHVGELLQATVVMLRARTVVAFVGSFWQPTGSSDPFMRLSSKRRPLLQTGRIDGRTWLVGWHPNGASHRGWGPRRYADRLIREHRGWQS